MKLRVFVGSLALVAVVAAAVFVLVPAGTSKLESRQILASAAAFESGLLGELGPGTTLHGIEIRYRRHGPISDRLAAEHGDFYQPESAVAEAWVVFDDAGDMASRRTEVRGLDGTVYQVTSLDGDELVSRDPITESEKRIPLSMLGIPATVSQFRDHQVEYAANWIDEMASASSTTVEEAELDGEPVWVIERTGPVTHFVSSSVTGGPPSPPEGTPGDEGPLSYALPYVEDLDLVEEVVRWSIRQSDYFLVKEETLGIGGDGSEYVLESRERTVLEVITP